jgi:hypothetical protein
MSRLERGWRLQLEQRADRGSCQIDAPHTVLKQADQKSEVWLSQHWESKSLVENAITRDFC